MTFGEVAAQAPVPLAAIGQSCAATFGIPERETATMIGGQACRLLTSPDPVLALIAARETHALATKCDASGRAVAARELHNFVYEESMLVLDAGWDEMEAIQQWHESGEARHLLDAHSALLDAVLAPMLRTCLSIAQRPQEPSAHLGTLMDSVRKLASEGRLRMWGLIDAAAKVDVRNARSHRRAFVRADGRIRVESQSRGVEIITADDLAFDHAMLKSLLAGVETGLFFAHATYPRGAPPQLTVLPQRALEHFLRQGLAEAGVPGPFSFVWDERAGTLTLWVAEEATAWWATAAIADGLAKVDPDAHPRDFSVRFSGDVQRNWLSRFVSRVRRSPDV